jgi:hypothetical protein
VSPALNETLIFSFSLPQSQEACGGFNHHAYTHCNAITFSLFFVLINIIQANINSVILSELRKEQKNDVTINECEYFGGQKNR